MPGIRLWHTRRTTTYSKTANMDSEEEDLICKTPGSSWLGPAQPGQGKEHGCRVPWFCQSILLHMIKALGITGKMGVWIHALLTGRLQAVGKSRGDHWSATRFSTGPSPLPDPYGRHWWEGGRLIPLLFCWWHQCESCHHCWTCASPPTPPQHSICLGNNK